MKIRELFSGPEKWTKGCFARDSEGQPVGPFFGGACCHCLIGALELCYPVMEEWKRARDKIRKALKQQSITDWNDSPERTFEEVKSLVETLDI